MEGEQNSSQVRTLSQRQSTSRPGSLKTSISTLDKSRHIRKRKCKNMRQRERGSSDTQPVEDSTVHTVPQHITPLSMVSASQKLQSRRSFELNDFISSTNNNDNKPEFQLDQLWEYLGEIGQHLLQLQVRFPPPTLNYSPYFGPNQRIKGISLISNYCSRLSLRLQTQFLAFDIFHRICTAPGFERYHSALKAASSLYLAAKYQEVSPPRACLFSCFDPTQQVFPDNIIRLEAQILMHLNFSLSQPLPLHFAQLLVIRYSLSTDSRVALLNLCLRAVLSEQVWIGGGSLLAMACASMVRGQVGASEQGWLKSELKWRVDRLNDLIRQ